MFQHVRTAECGGMGSDPSDLNKCGPGGQKKVTTLGLEPRVS
jgi:hypothetical protein